MLEDVTPFKPLVFKVKYDNRAVMQNIQSTIYAVKDDRPSIYDQEQGILKDGILTSAVDDDKSRNPHTWDATKPFLDDMRRYIVPISEKWVWPRVTQFRVNRSWFNITKNGSWSDEHTHLGSADIVLTFYLKKPEGTGDILFRNPYVGFGRYEEMIDPFFKLVEVEEGDAVFFPGWLPHKSGINHTDEDRIILSFNIQVMTEANACESEY